MNSAVPASPSTTGILIVGAGPTGLTMANALAAYGIPFTIIDRKSGPSRDSKALALNLASQHVLESLGMKGMLGTSNGRLRRVTVHWKDMRLTKVDLRRLNFDHRELIVQPQSETECELIEALRHRGGDVSWNTRLLDITEHDQHIEALIEHADGSRSTQTFSYAVGCEGKGSLVANRIGVQYDSIDYPAHFVLGDFSLRWNASRHEGHYYVDDDGFFIILPVGETDWRVVVKRDGTVPEHRPVAVSDVTDYVEKRLGKDIFAGQPSWLSRAAFYMRIANRLRSKRLFIAGDAAHLFSPIGGTGMNTGMQDALNLAWKLALHYRGVACEKLLDSYESERLEIIRATGAATDKSTRLIARLDDDPASIAPLLPKMSNRKVLRSVLPVLHSGLGVASPQAFAGCSDDAVPGSRRAGQICLAQREFSSILQRAGIQSTTNQGLPKLLAVARPEGSEDAIQLRGLLAGLQAYAGLVDVLVLTEDPTALPAMQNAATIVFASPRQAALAYGDIGRHGLLLVHPDAVIGFSGSVMQPERLLQSLDMHFAHRPQSPQSIANAA